MNIWDSVQRGLEKATHEAARIAKVQRLRTTLDGLSKQIEAQQGAITLKAMELFKNGHLTQSELLVLCQELSSSRQQFAQAQSELKQVQQSQSNQGTQTIQPNATVAYTQPAYLSYDSTLPDLVPPPPPGVEPLPISSHETIRVDIPPPPPAINELQHCAACQAVLIPGNAFCHNCGTPVHSDSSYQPTIRASGNEPSDVEHEEKTILDSDKQATIHVDKSSLSEKRQDGGI